MNQEKIKRDRAIAFFLSLILFIMAFLLVPGISHAASFSDISGHWSEFYIKKVNYAKVISGYPDGSFRPDKAVSRAEFISMVNKAFDLDRLDVTDAVQLNDVPYTSWFYQDVSIAIAAGYASGYSDSTFKPNSPISRQEASVMLARLIPEGKKSGSLKSFSDYKTVATWASDAIAKLNGKGYIGAYSDNMLHPSDSLTRGQTAKILSEILDNEDIITAKTTIDDDETELTDKIYVNDLVIDEDLQDGSVTIENCIILGDFIIEGGGDGTVTINNSSAVSVSVEGDEGQIKIITKGTTTIANLDLSGSCYLQTSGKDGQGTPDIVLNKAADATLKGSFPKVSLEGSRATLTLESGTITDLQVTGLAKYSDIILPGKAKVTEATVNAESYFHGEGTIGYLYVNADNVTYETKPDKMTVGLQVDRPESEGEEEITVSFKPKSKADDVDVDTEITITFNTSITLASGKEITDSNISTFISLHLYKKSGDEVDFTAAINSAKKIITLTPSEELAEGTKYYVVLADESVENGGGNLNDGESAYFTTEGDSEDDEDDDDTSTTTPSLSSFSLTATATTITATFTPNVAGTVYVLASTSSTTPSTAEVLAGKSVSATASTSGTITLTGLTAGTTYYVYTLLQNSSGTNSSIVSANTTTSTE